MPGLSLLQLGGALAEVTATAAASMVLILAISSVVRTPVAIESETDEEPADDEKEPKFHRRPEVVS